MEETEDKRTQGEWDASQIAARTILLSTVESPWAGSFLCVLSLATAKSAGKPIIELGGSLFDDILTCPTMAVAFKRDAGLLVWLTSHPITIEPSSHVASPAQAMLSNLSSWEPPLLREPSDTFTTVAASTIKRLSRGWSALVIRQSDLWAFRRSQYPVDFLTLPSHGFAVNQCFQARAWDVRVGVA